MTARRELPSAISRPVVVAASAVAQRIRVGLTGLAAIFLLVLVAAVGVRPGQSVARDQAGMDARRTGPVAAGQAEPLAVLGVAPAAPGESPAARSASAPAPESTRR